MNINRRNFFSNLFSGIVAASIAPSIIVPRLADRQLWKPSRKIVVPRRKLKVTWTAELEQDLQAYYHIDAEKEITKYLTQYAQTDIQNEIDQSFLNQINLI